MLNQTAVNTSRLRYDRDNNPHVRAIDSLVHELGISAEEVNRTYRELLEEQKKVVTVKAFLPILVSSAVKERLLRQR